MPPNLDSHPFKGETADDLESGINLRQPMTRRRALAQSLKFAGLTGLAATGLATAGITFARHGWNETVRTFYPRHRMLTQASTPTPTQTPTQALIANTSGAVNNAFSFQDFMMDLYAQGNTLRLAQSFSDQADNDTTAYVYDIALTMIAYLGQSSSNGLARAKILGHSLLYAQQHDPIGDGRLRDCYLTNPFICSNGSVNLVSDDQGSDVGNMAWTGLGLMQLYARTGDTSILDGALKLGNWIYNNNYSTTGAGGYTSGLDPNNQPQTYKSTELNIDTYAFFTMLAKATGDRSWTTKAQHAKTFVQALYDTQNQRFFTGTDNDGVSINLDLMPEDVQTWSYLALQDPTYQASIDWAVSHLITTDTSSSPNASFSGNLSFTGATFSLSSLTAKSPADPHAVWLEGTGHLATALLYRNAPGDLNKALSYLSTIQSAQQQLGKKQTANGVAIPPCRGIVASSSILDTGDNDSYHPALHIGATAWFLMAALRLNPFII